MANNVMLDEKYFMMRFPARLKYLRAQSDLTQREVAEALFVDRSTYAYYETGKTEPRIGSLPILSRLFSVSVDDLLKNL